MSESTQVAVTRKGVAGMILSDAGRARLEGLVPKGDTLERIASVAALAVRANPKLAECEPLSILESIGKILSWGLEVGETGFLVPRGKVCKPQKGSQAVIQLMYDSGHVRAVDARCVYEGEHFEIMQGLEPKLEHRPSATARERGKLLGAYCIIRLAFGNFVMEWYPADAIDAIRQKFSQAWKDGPLQPWYATKTAVIHTAKLLPKNSKFKSLHEALRQEEQAEEIDVDVTTGEVAENPHVAFRGAANKNVAPDYARQEPMPTARVLTDSERDPYGLEEDAA